MISVSRIPKPFLIEFITRSRAPALSAVRRRTTGVLPTKEQSRMPLHQLATIAVLGADTVVGSALCALLGGCGYSIIPIDARPTGVVDELLEGANLLLLAPRLEKEAQETFLGAIGESVRQRARVPVIALTTALEDALPEGRAESVPWPLETKRLGERIGAPLAGGPPTGAPKGPAKGGG